MKPTIAIVFTMILVGCAPVEVETIPIIYPKQENQDKAIDFIWYDFFGMRQSPPEIEWVLGEKCKNLDAPSIIVGVPPNEICAAGTYRNMHIRLVVPMSGSVFLDGFVHELTHAKLDIEFNNIDVNHNIYTSDWNNVPALDDLLVLTGY